MSAVEDLSSDEKQAYELISSHDGILQSDLWKELDITSRKGSRLATSLAKKDLLTREQTTSDGRLTYRLEPTNSDASTRTQQEHDNAGSVAEEQSSDSLSARENRALALITEQKGIYQSDLWKELEVSSRTGSRLATSLEEKGMIQREETTYNGQRTYLLLPRKKDLDFSLLMAGDMLSPLFSAEEESDPIDSNAFTQWVLQLSQEAH
jgi:DNA-binding MarR family transcriptional regulator